MKAKYVYMFGGNKADGSAAMKALLGGKGANLAEMTNIGLPVPPGFTISTEVCACYYANRKKYPPRLADDIDRAMKGIEKLTAKNSRPVKSAAGIGCPARASMPE